MKKTVRIDRDELEFVVAQLELLTAMLPQAVAPRTPDDTLDDISRRAIINTAVTALKSDIKKLRKPLNPNVLIKIIDFLKTC